MGFFKEKAKDKPSSNSSSSSNDDLRIDDTPMQAPPKGGHPPGYGIQHAIELMRSLPADLQTTDIVVQVIKRTLESAGIDVGTIIADATHKEESIETRIRKLQTEIASYQKEIETRNGEIGTLQTDLEETTRVKERLVLAEKITSG